ncbi:MAG: SpoIIE family protein phosphatase [Candidatus Promineifilaceae bacterium]|jgi:class 3 adenylate cyclase/tetratricopeptide (TPR) repeat protein
MSEAETGSAQSRLTDEIIPTSRRCSNCRMALPAGARFCLNCGKPVSDRIPTGREMFIDLTAAAPLPLLEKVRAAAYLTGERRLVTAVFVDVVGSTALSEQVGPVAWSTILEKMCAWFCPIIYRYEGTIARFVGDELLAFFGAPVAHEDDPLRAVHAALDILDTVRQAAENIHQEFNVDFKVRISLSSGPVTIGPVSRDLQFEYSALEGTLNQVAQLEATKRAMAVLLSEETYRLVAPFFNCLDLGKTDSKDQASDVRIYQVQAPRETSDKLTSIAGLQSPMVGRDRELQILLELTDAVAAGLGRAVLIVGESGLGKKRLVAEWNEAVTRTSRQPALHWACARCLSYSQATTYHLLRDLLRSLIGVSTTASEPETRAALRTLTSDLFGDAALDVYPYLGYLLSVNLEDEILPRVQSLDPPALQMQYLAACRRLLLTLATRNPLILVLEDLQWADPSSTAILRQLIPLAAATPILFGLVARPHRDTPGWQLVTASRDTLGERFIELVLKNLAETDSRQMIFNLLNIANLPEKVQQLILEKAEGNPLFIEEVLRMMIDQGAIKRENGGWTTGRAIGTVGIPDNLQGLLLARMDRLPDDAKQTLRIAAVIGRQFPVRLLEQVLTDGQGGMTLINELGDLESNGLIDVHQVKPELIYRFHNTLLQDTLYASLLTADRKRLHLAVGTAMETLHPENLEELAPQLARHFLVGGDNTRAFTYLSLAGDAALNACANEEAENLYRLALNLTPALDEQATLIFKMGQALYWQSRFQEAIRVWAGGINLFKELGDSDGVARLYARSARACWDSGDTPGGLRLCQEGLAEISDAPESPGLALLLHEAARAYLFNGLREEAQHFCRQALGIAERLGDIAVQTEALATLGLFPDQPPEEALAALSKAAELAESAALLSQAARAHINMAALLATVLPDFAAARDHYQRGAELHRLRGNTAGELLGLGGMAGALLEAGRFDEVEETLPLMRHLLDEFANPGPGAFHIRISEALLSRYRGELAEAAQMFRTLQTEERRRGNLRNLVDVNIYLAELIFASHVMHNQPEIGDWVEAEAALGEAIEIYESWSMFDLKPRSILSMIYTGQGRLDEAGKLLPKAQEMGNARPIAIDLAWPILAEARLAAAEPRWLKALTLFKNAADIFTRLGMQWQQAYVFLEWAEAYRSRQEPTDLEQARTLLQDASTMFSKMGIPFYANLAQKELQDLEVASYAQALAHQRVDQEMEAAGKIQSGLLPVKPPQIPGWQLAAKLEPSRQTSGDFYDFIHFPDGRLGIVIADVADKGAAAALFMALSSSLIRTYAAQYENQPELVLGETNRRILADTHTDLFVTVFYAELDPSTGTITYANAGHNPPYHFHSHGGVVQPLKCTGLPVGILEGSTWGTGAIQLSPGDVLVLYTDGVTDAQNREETFFGSERLLACAQHNLAQTAQEIEEAILAGIHEFAAGSPQFDDVALIVIRRETR